MLRRYATFSAVITGAERRSLGMRQEAGLRAEQDGGQEKELLHCDGDGSVVSGERER